jgi:radical SAM protein with 4Fe4S-binding SPASM domain
MSTFRRIAINNARNEASQWLYRFTGINLTYPTQIYGMLNTRCNAKCIMCDFWRREDPVELPHEVWQRHLVTLRELIGPFFINFSGGEPTIYRGLWEIFQTCQENDILYGVTTNGYTLSEKVANKLVNHGIFNCNISLDGATAEVHDKLRGIPGGFNRILRGIDHVKEASQAKNHPVRIILKMAVNKLNLDEVPDLIETVKRLGLTGINFQPVFKWTDAVNNDLWINDQDHLRRIIARVIEMKRQGYPVMGSERSIELWEDHFAEADIHGYKGNRCTVGLTNYQIRQNGDVYLCSEFPPIGNIRHQNAAEIWHSPEARRQVREVDTCERLCLNTCKVKKNLREKVSLFLKLTKASK